MDKPEYDRPEDAETRGGKALMYVVLALAVIAIFVFGIYR